jgi:hypothetical protein
MFRKKKRKGALVKAATTIGKTAGKLAAVVSETAEKTTALIDRDTKKSKKKPNRKTAKKVGVVSKIKGIVTKSKK